MLPLDSPRGCGTELVVRPGDRLTLSAYLAYMESVGKGFSVNQGPGRRRG